MHITTERLVLKPHTAGSLAWLNAAFNHPGEAYLNSDEPPKERPETLAETQVLLDRILNRPPGADIIDYAIHLRGTETLIGVGMIAHLDRHNRRCHLGISLGWDRSVWGCGYASEALQGVVAYCFNELGLNRLGAEIYEMNERSIRLFERNGFRREGVLRQHVLKSGQFKDTFLYSLLKAEWLDARRG